MIKILLYPIGLIFIFLNRLRRIFYKIGYLKSTKLPQKVISIGNITFGGTGKTPFTIFLAKEIEKEGIKCAVILRGYKRKTKEAILVGEDSELEEVGDEALIYKLNDISNVIVAKKREDALNLLKSEVKVIILDDGFQHLRVKRDLDIVLLDASNKIDYFAPPIGRLREPLSSLKEAHLTGITKGVFKDLPQKVKKYLKEEKTFTIDFIFEDELKPVPIKIENLNKLKLISICGIGNPSHFFKMAERYNIKFLYSFIFKDHQSPNQRLLRTVLEKIEETNCDYIFTTEKDYVKWRKTQIKDKLIYPELKIEFKTGKEQFFKKVMELFDEG